MKRDRTRATLGVLCLLVAATLAWSAEMLTLRTRSGVVWSGEVVKTDERGVLIRTPENVQVLLLWGELSDESRGALARSLGLEDAGPGEGGAAAAGKGTGPEAGTDTHPRAGLRRPGLVRVLTRKGETVTGTLEDRPGAPAELIFVREGDRLHEFVRSEVEVQMAALDPRGVGVYPEAYLTRVEENPPRDEPGHRALAFECETWGLTRLAEHHHRVADALGMSGVPACGAMGWAQELRGATREGLAPEFAEVIEERVLEHDWEGALGLVRARIPAAQAGSVSDALRALALHLDAAENAPTPQDRLTFAVHLALDAHLRGIAGRMELGYDAAMAELNGDVVGAVAEEEGRKQGLAREEALRRFGMRQAGCTRVIGYGGATWVVEAPGLAPADHWWKGAGREERLAFLRGRLAEARLQVLAVRHKGCSQCGGAGIRTPAATTAEVFSEEPAEAAAGRARCPRCLGLGIERVVVYQ